MDGGGVSYLRKEMNHMTKKERAGKKAWATRYLTELTGDLEGAALTASIAEFMGRMDTARRKDFCRWVRSLAQAYNSVIFQPERRKHENMST